MSSQNHRIEFTSNSKNTGKAEANYRLFKAAVKALDPLNGVAIAWFCRHRHGYVALSDTSCFARIGELAASFGFSASEPELEA